MYMSGNRQQRQWIIQAARELELMPTTEGGLDYKIDITHAIDGYPGIEHNLPIAPMYSDVVELFKESETTNTPTLLVSYGGPFGENYFYATENAHDDPKLNMFVPSDNIDARTRRRGSGAGNSPGPVGWFPGGGARLPTPRRIREEGARRRWAHGRRKPRADTGRGLPLGTVGHGGGRRVQPRHAARGDDPWRRGDRLRKQLGSIEKDKFADIVILNSNPLDDLRNTVDIHQVMKDGRLYDGMTLDEVYPEERALERRRPAEADPASNLGRNPARLSGDDEAGRAVRVWVTRAAGELPPGPTATRPHRPPPRPPAAAPA